MLSPDKKGLELDLSKQLLWGIEPYAHAGWYGRHKWDITGGVRWDLPWP